MTKTPKQHKSSVTVKFKIDINSKTAAKKLDKANFEKCVKYEMRALMINSSSKKVG